MTELAFKQLSNQIEMLSYSERIRLLDKIVKTLNTPVKTTVKKSADFDKAFGLWASRDISVEEIRKKAWSRSE
ncbi:MAG: hypothetical protein J6W60_00440 [Treponema sp.]|nr:hypothetical protein [Treponema sp.]MBP5751314.1 hypothetical protein [Treponema sp.]